MCLSIIFIRSYFFWFVEYEMLQMWFIFTGAYLYLLLATAGYFDNMLVRVLARIVTLPSLIVGVDFGQNYHTISLY